MLTPQQKSALALLKQYEKTEALYDEANAMFDTGESDFPPHVPPIDDKLLTAMVALLDEVLGENLASYYLWDCGRDGKIILKDGTEYPIKSVEDIGVYLGARE